ncbi:hypothetical protein Tco_0206985 [Tanacetum coccineum]
MDSMFQTRQKNTLAEYMILSGAANRPPILDKDLYDSWKSRMKLYMQNKEHGRMILESVEHSPLIWPTIEENSVTRTKKYVELSPAEKIQADCDMKAIKIILQEAPTELPKVSLVNESLKKLKLHLARFDNVVKIRTTPDACTEGEWGFEHTKAIFNNEIIPFLKSLKNIFNVFDRDLLNEIMEVQTVFDQMDADVQQSSIDKQCLDIAKKELLLENDRIL